MRILDPSLYCRTDLPDIMPECWTREAITDWLPRFFISLEMNEDRLTTVTRVTLDTNILPPDEVKAAAKGLPIEFTVVSVTARETEGTDKANQAETIPETGVWDESTWGNFIWAPETKETGVFGESVFGGTVFGSAAGADLLEKILQIISNGSFPTRDRRENLANGERRQLRDAMILEAHVREGRDIFVTNDLRAFVRGASDPNERRVKLERLTNTRIMTAAEFVKYCNERKTRG